MDEIMFFMLDEPDAPARPVSRAPAGASPRKERAAETAPPRVSALLPSASQPSGAQPSSPEPPPSDRPSTPPIPVQSTPPEPETTHTDDARADAAQPAATPSARRKPKSKDDTEDSLQKLREILSDQKLLAALLHLLNK